MNIYHVEFAKTGKNLSGGEVCMLELAKYFQSLGYKNIILTTDNGAETYKKELPGSDLVEYRTVNAYRNERLFGVFASYALRIRPALKLTNKLELTSDDIVICHSLFFPNSIPAWVLNKRNRHAKSVNFFHTKSPKIFNGYIGEFTGRHEIPKLNVIHFGLNQWLYRLLTFPRTLIVTVNPYYEAYLKKRYPRNRVKVLRHFWGVSVQVNKNLPKKYDLIWVGRFQGLKGIDDFVRLVKELTASKPDASAVIVGDGSPKNKLVIMAQIKRLGISDNVHLTGWLSGEEKFDYFLRSRVFVMTSYFESFGGVILEAMACGLPVVAYDLPVYDVFGDGISRVPILNYIKLADKAAALLQDKRAYFEAKTKAQAIAATHSWNQTAEELLAELS